MKQRQNTFLSRILQERQDERDDPFMFAWRLNYEAWTKGARSLNGVINPDRDYAKEGLTNLKAWAMNSEKSKVRTYVAMNPSLEVLPMYCGRPSSWIPEHMRVVCTRFRLSAHRLRIETGRWSRLRYEQRLCECGDVQTEEHVLRFCPLVVNIRLQYQQADFSFPGVFHNRHKELFALYNIMKYFE